MNIVNSIKNLFERNKTDLRCPKCNSRLYLKGQLKLINSEKGVYYLECKKCKEVYNVVKV